MKSPAGLGVTAWLLLTAATPPAWFPGAEGLVLPGLMALYALITTAARPYRWVYLVVCGHTLFFSWSLRHTILPGWAAIGLIAGLYGMLMVFWARKLRRLGGPLAFALALAGTQWLRAHMVQFPYPHGQPAHSLYEWSELLTVVRWGGEPLANAILAGIGAALVDLYRSWRVADPPWKRSVRRAALWVGGTLLLTVFPPPRAFVPDDQTVRVVAIEPGLEPEIVFGVDPWRSMLPRLQAATDEVAGLRSADPPDLVLWPESSYPGLITAGGLLTGPRGMTPPQPRLQAGTRLVVGAAILRDGGRVTPASILLGDQGRYIAHHEKLIPVPAGERIPFLDWLVALLPESMGSSFVNWMLEAGVPAALPGRSLPPLQTADGLPFGSLMCFDNAFDTVAARHVQNGARLLVVLSNEAWYRGGGELEQMVAMTVFRALELGTPLVRCTVDGVSLAVDRRGGFRTRVEDRDRQAPPQARTMDVTLDVGPGSLPPLAWLSDAILALVLGSGLLVLLHRALSCARLIRTPTVSEAPPGTGPPGPPEGGS